jgi:hypothetical protein
MIERSPRGAMETRTITLVAAGALGGAVVTAVMLLSHRATAALPSMPSPHPTLVACPPAMVAKTGAWTLSAGPWKPSAVTPSTPLLSAPGSPAAAPGPVYGPFMKMPDGSYELPSGAVTPTSTFRLAGVFVEPFQRLLKCEYSTTSDMAPYASFTVTQPYPVGQECMTTAQSPSTRTFVCQ